MSFKIVILSQNKSSAQTLIDALDPSIRIAKIIIDPGTSRRKIFTNRIKRIGAVAFVGQLLFRFIVVPYLNSSSRKRKQQLSASYSKSRASDPLPPVESIENINSLEGSRLLNDAAPDAIVVVTRRIISKGTLNRVSAPLINIHDGIVPKYRGLFGAYWAMVAGDREHCGATVHFIDKGLDTGPIIAQSNIFDTLTAEDNFTTYPIHQFASALPLLNKALLDMANDRLETVERSSEVGKIRYIPTIWAYLGHRLGKGIK
ncbi:MAG TPA: formyl transferase [Pricia sp.]|nr:formyl transferase [Pricia sp.]